MDAEKFLITKSRMCNSYDRCYNCPLISNCSGKNPSLTVSIVERWGMENPIYSWYDVLYSLYKESNDSQTYTFYDWLKRTPVDSAQLNYGTNH